jgi:hypothetical protein
MKSRLDLGFVAQPRNRPPTSSYCSCHHAARTRPCWPSGPSNEAYLSSRHLEASPATNFRACSSPAPTRVKPQPAAAILSQESVHTTLSITHHTRKRPSTGPRTTHGPHKGPLRFRRQTKVFDGMLLMVTAAGHGLAGGEIPQRLASGLLTVAPRAPLGLLARWVTHQRATTFAAWSAPARARRRRRDGGAGVGTSLRSEGRATCT